MRSGSRTVVFAVLGSMVAILAIGGWLTWSRWISEGVAVSWSPESPRCEGTRVSRAGSRRPIIEAVVDMRCVITVQVSNDGGHTVRATRARAPFVGPGTGAVVTAPEARSAEQGANDIDGEFALNQTLASGESMTFDVVLVFHPEGCNDGGTLRVPGWPTVTVEALGRAHEVQANADFAFRRTGATPGCDY